MIPGMLKTGGSIYQGKCRHAVGAVLFDVIENLNVIGLRHWQPGKAPIWCYI